MDLIVNPRRLAPMPGGSALVAGRALALRVRSALAAAGFACDDVCALGDGWGFLVEPERSPVGITVEPADAATDAWYVGVDYDGGLSTLWGRERRREGLALVGRIEAVVRDVFIERPSARTNVDDPRPTPTLD
jgi:hypothetical protein